ncbi:hypothetical protein PanWU01x14_020220 [Parasponia andersonii]|uniref:Uncharacterized protein n=1 Tax=Parasponia andersonii TaxID=3476 RepID=A0A2P5DYN7_PARAD|nr:hypothetical protein PanWU01x14_020220 [Parasponia andersonii]
MASFWLQTDHKLPWYVDNFKRSELPPLPSSAPSTAITTRGRRDENTAAKISPIGDQTTLNELSESLEPLTKPSEQLDRAVDYNFRAVDHIVDRRPSVNFDQLIYKSILRFFNALDDDRFEKISSATSAKERKKIANIAKEVNMAVVEDKPEDKDVVQVKVMDEVGILTTTIIISTISKEEKALQEVVVEVK